MFQQLDSSDLKFKNFITSILVLGLAEATRNIMYSVDRIILARYSIEAMSVAAFSSTAVHTISTPLAAFVGTAVIFIGNANGAKQYKQVSTVMWTMLVVCFFMSFIYLMSTLSIRYIPFPQFFHAHMSYLQIIVLFGFLDPLNTALSSFYIGIKKNNLVILSIIVGNILNLVLSILLVFGYGAIPSLGAKGAAIGTVVSELVQNLILFFGFFTKKHTRLYKLHIITLDKEFFYKALSLGSMSALLFFVENAGFLFSMYVYSQAGVIYATINSITLNILIFLHFFLTAPLKVITSYASNLIGANKTYLIPKLTRFSLYLWLIIGLILVFPLVIFANFFINLFVSYGFDYSCDDYLVGQLKLTLGTVWIYFLGEYLIFHCRGVLFAFKKVIFATSVTVFCSLFFFTLPIYIINYHTEYFRPSTSWIVLMTYVLITGILLYYKYRLVVKSTVVSSVKMTKLDTSTFN